MKRKILFFIVLLVFIISCGNKKNNNSSNELKDIGKFNFYASVYNDMSDINGEISEYFREVGEAERIKKSETVRNININENTIEKLQNGKFG